MLNSSAAGGICMQKLLTMRGGGAAKHCAWSQIGDCQHETPYLHPNYPVLLITK